MVEYTGNPWDFFFCGLAFLWLAAVARTLGRQPGEKWPWGWLACFALIYGAGLWVAALTAGQPATLALQAVRMTVAAGAFAALFEFGRRTMRRLGGRVWGNWLYAPLIGLVAVGVLVGAWLDPAIFCAAAGRLGQIATASCALLAAAGLWWRGRRLSSPQPGYFRYWQVPLGAVLVIAAGWSGSAWRASRAESAAQVLLVSASDAAAEAGQGSVRGEVVVELKDRGDSAGRESLAARRLRSGMPLLLVNLGIAAVLVTLWALAQRFSRW